MKLLYRLITFTFYYTRIIWVIDFFTKAYHKDVILGYHRIKEKNDFLPNGLLITKKLFNKQMKLISRKFKIVNLNDLLISETNQEEKKRRLVVTVDDGFKDVLTHGYKIFERHNINFTLFVTTSMIERKTLLPLHKFYYLMYNTPNDFFINSIARDSSLKNKLKNLISKPEKFVREVENNISLQLNTKEGQNFIEKLDKNSITKNESSSLYLSWNDLIKIKSSGNSIGVHTHNHPRLGCLNYDDQKKEIEKSLNLINQKLDQESTLFAYPFGDKNSYNKTTIKILKEFGFSSACTAIDGFHYRENDHFELKRKMNLNKPIDVFAFEILGFDQFLRGIYRNVKNKYDYYFQFMPIGQVMRYRNVFNNIRNLKADNILEIGSSSPQYLKKLSELFADSNVVGIDIVKENIKYINETNIKNLKYFCEDIQKPSQMLKSKKFDLIICSDVLAHIKEDIKSLKNIFGLLNRGGVLYLHTPTKVWHRIFKGSKKFTIESFDMVRPGYEMDVIQEALTNVGFKIIQSNFTNRFFGRLVWELEQKANRFRLVTKLVFPFLKALSRLDLFFGGKANGIAILCKKNEK